MILPDDDIVDWRLGCALDRDGRMQKLRTITNESAMPAIFTI